MTVTMPTTDSSGSLSFVSDSLWDWQERHEQGEFRAKAPVKTETKKRERGGSTPVITAATKVAW